MTPCHVNSLGHSTSRSNYGFFHSAWRDFDMFYFCKFWLIFWRVPWGVFPTHRFEKWVYLYSVGSWERRILMWWPVWKKLGCIIWPPQRSKKSQCVTCTSAHDTAAKSWSSPTYLVYLFFTPPKYFWVSSHVDCVAVCCSKRRVLESISKTSSLFNIMEMRAKFT